MCGDHVEVQGSTHVALGLVDQPERVEGVGGVGVFLNHLQGDSGVGRSGVGRSGEGGKREDGR